MLDDDMKLEALPQTNHIKAIVTAELPMDLERKGQQSYQGDLYVRFLGFGNGLAQSALRPERGLFQASNNSHDEAERQRPNRRPVYSGEDVR